MQTMQKRRWKRKASAYVAEDIANEIIGKNLAEGTVLAGEKEMTAAYDVGRSTIREALRLLESRGVVTVKSGPGGGPIVRTPRTHDLGEALSLILQFSKASLGDVLDALNTIGPLLMESAAANISEEQLDELQKSVEVARANVNDSDAFLEQYRRFHLVISDAAQCIVLRVFYDSLLTLTTGSAINIHYSARRISATADSHQRIVDALRQHDRHGAALAMKTHLTDTESFWKRMYKEVYDQPVRWLQF